MVQNLWFGDSHLCGHHHVPEIFYRIVREREDLDKFHRPISEEAKSGRYMGKGLLKEIFEKEKQFRGQAAIFVIQAGSNNLRAKGDKKVIAEQLLDDYQELKDHFTKFSKQHALIVTSVIPDSNPQLKICLLYTSDAADE